jgi:hypothetical protein
MCGAGYWSLATGHWLLGGRAGLVTGHWLLGRRVVSGRVTARHCEGGGELETGAQRFGIFIERHRPW